MRKLFSLSGRYIRPIGLGTYPLQGQAMENMLLKAFEAGYMLIDTADDYRGEIGIGYAVRRLGEIGLKREDIFLQTKISENSAYDDDPLEGLYFNRYSEFMKRHSVEDVVREKISISLREMKTDYLDSVLIHYPYEFYYLEIWTALIKLQQEGIIRYLGVSNFHKRHIEQLKQTGVMPAINEIYVSPIGCKHGQIEYAKENDIIIMSYSPLMDLASKRIPLDEITKIAKKHQKSEAQVILRWNIERGCYPLPRTRNVLRLKENIDLFDFSLTSEEVSLISALDRDYQCLIESKICPGL